MGRTSEEDVMTQLDKMAQVQRTPTIPMTKRESVSSASTRVPLLSNNGTLSDPTKKWESKDYINNNPNMVAGKKRSPRTNKRVKRRDSYKIALNRDSVHNSLDDNTFNMVDGSGSTRIPTSGLSRGEERKKYNTLPRAVPAIETISTVKKVHKHESKTLKMSKDFDRNASTRSGTCPSPDTDTDQHTVMTDRKKKSAFKRMKERLILTLKRDRVLQKTDKDKKGTKKKSSSKAQINPKSRTPAKTEAFGTPSDSIEVLEDSHKTNFSNANGSSRSPLSSSDKRRGYEDGSSSDKKSGFFRSFRESMRRKSHTRSKTKGSADQKWSAPQTSNSSQSQSSSSMERGTGSFNGGIQYHSATKPKVTDKDDKMLTEKQIKTEAEIAEIEEKFVDTTDSITGLFESLIDPSTSVASSNRPDTSKLRLNGLKKCRPRSPPSSHHYVSHRDFFSERLPSLVEIDGVDEADGVTEFEQEEELQYADVSQAEKQRRIDDVARCLAAIGDNIANKRESESAGSSMEDSPQRTELELGLLKDLRELGDEIDGALFGPDSRVKFSILPTVVKIIKAHNYKGFQTVIKQELRDTVGWEQVAWYTYLMKSAVYIANTGKTVGTLVRRHATQYFSSNLQPWIRSRPNGWESIHEETDIESELD
ncbi:hypothetical protein ACF0H5_007569 [Mactra antiquata]